MRSLLGACLLLIPILCCAQRATAQEKDGPRLVVLEKFTNLEAGKDATLNLAVPADPAMRGRVVWTVNLGAASIARGEGELGNQKSVAVKIPGQTVKPGVILEATLIASVIRMGDAAPLSKLVQPLWILPADPFADRREWAKKLNVVLYDPKGTTAETLKKADFPFEEQRNLAALEETKTGLVLIGEGLSWREEAGLGDVMAKLADRGVAVLCLAPAEGTIGVPGLGKTPNKNLASLELKKRAVITSWDKRLDVDSWHGKPPVFAALRLLGEGEDVTCTATPVVAPAGDDGWPWLAVRFNDRGVLAVNGFGIIRHWDAGPTPRYVFLRMLEKLTEKKEDRGPAK